MKAYLLDIVNRVKRLSESLDASAMLCDKAWCVFNDSGEKEIFLFKHDGNVIVTSNGVGIQGSWEWIAANKSLIINQNNTIVMLHPAYVDDIVLAMNLDGTEKYAFLVEEKNQQQFYPKTLTQLESYFKAKEQVALWNEQECLAAEEQRKPAEERKEIKRKNMQLAREKYKQLTDSVDWSTPYYLLMVLIVGCLLAAIGWIIVPLLGSIVGFCLGIPLAAVMTGKRMRKKKNEIAKQYILSHPNEELTPYLKAVMEEMANANNPYTGSL